jgi:hypothetical protein
MSALSWIKRRAVQREIEKLHEKIEAQRLVLVARPVTTVGTWFTGAGLSLASGFVTGVSGSIPSSFDRDNFLRLLMYASSHAIATAAAFVSTYPPNTVPDSGPAAPGNGAAAADGDTAGDAQATRADLLNRLRQQSAGADRTG